MKEGSTYHYSAEDLQRYIDGKMTALEMHAIERAALEDPFLADAIEGIREMHPNLKTDLMEIKNKLSEQTEPKSVKRSWLVIVAAAAIVISLSLGGWLFFRDAETPQIAKLEESTAPPPVNETTQDTAAVAAIAVPPDTATIQPVQAEEPLSSKKSAPAPAKIAAETADTKEKKLAPDPSVAATTPPAASELELARSEPAAAKKQIVATPNAEAKKSSVPVKNAAAPQAQPNADLVLEMAKNVEPANGWSAFAKYVAGNMQRPTGANAGLHGKVPMSFIVDPDGSISNIKVERSLHPEYDKEAVRLLTNGPKWKASNADKPVRAVYTIVF